MDFLGELLGFAFAAFVIGFVLFTIVGTFLGFVATPPDIDSFTPRAELTSTITRNLSTDALVQAVDRIPGMSVVQRSGPVVLVSVRPGIRSLERGTGSWVRILPGDSQMLFQIRAKNMINMTVYPSALREAEQEIRLALTRSGAVDFNVYENVAVPKASASETPQEAGPTPGAPSSGDQGSSGKWWET